MTLLERYNNAKCCFSATVYGLTQAQWKGEDTECALYDSVKAYNAFGALTRNLFISQDAQSIWDLTDFVVGTDQLQYDIQTSDGTQLAYSSARVFSDLTELVNDIAGSINAGNDYRAIVNGFEIQLNTTRPANIGITATLTLNSVFAILNPQTSGGVTYTIEPSSPGFLPFFTCYNELDGYWWVSNSVYSANTTMAICDKAGLISLETYAGQVGQRGISFNLNNERVYLGASAIKVIDADPNSGTYKTALATLATGGLIMSLQSSPYNDYLYAMYAVASGNPVRVRIYQPDNSVAATLLLSNYTSFSNWFNTIALTQDYCYALGYETDEVYQIDADPISGTFNTVINTLSFTKPCSLKIFNGRFFIVHGAYNFVEATLSEVDSSFNILQSITVVQTNDSKGCDFHVKDQYLYVQATGNTVRIYNVADFSFQTTISQVPVGEFFESPDGSLWVTTASGTTIAIFDEDIQTFRYDLNFDDQSSYTTTCLDYDSILRLFCTMEGICSNCGTAGVFGDSQNILGGNGVGDYIDGNGLPISV